MYIKGGSYQKKNNKKLIKVVETVFQDKILKGGFFFSHHPFWGVLLCRNNILCKHMSNYKNTQDVGWILIGIQYVVENGNENHKNSG